jgi:glycosyltransferase involved in cell wall biosynthesis
MPNAARPPSVTVVIPCYNQARYLRAAIASVRAQECHALECLVVDDGSTDDTAAVGQSEGARVLRQSNEGLSEARNAGLAASRGDFVVFLDADDELLPGAVTRAAAELERWPEVSAVVGRCQAMDADGRALPVRHEPIDASRLYEEWLPRNFVWTPGAAMFRKQAVEAVGGFPRRLGPAADYAIYLQLSREGRVRFLDEPLVRYRQHGTSMSTDPGLMLRATLAVLRRERREVPADLQPQFRRGRNQWCEFYGEQIVERLRTDWEERRLGVAQVRAAVTLLRHCPRVAFRHVRHKTGLVLTGRWPRVSRLILRGAIGRRENR